MLLKHLKVPEVAFHPILNPALEKEMSYRERIKGASLTHRILVKIAGMLAYVPEWSFDKNDYNPEIVKKLLQHKDLLKVLDEWISDTNYELLPQLAKAKTILAAISPPKPYKKLYRGFSFNGHDLFDGQQSMGLKSNKNWHGGRSYDFKAGETFTFTPTKPLSFSHHEGTAQSYGKIVVSIDAAREKTRMLHLTNEVVVALIEADTDYEHRFNYYTTYGESVLIPDNKPLHFTVESIGKKK